MEYVQSELPMGRNGEDNCRAPARSRSQAIGYKGNCFIEYLIVGSSGGQSAESGELLCQVFVEKTEQAELWYKDEYFIPGHPFRNQLQLFVNANGDAYRSWKGKLAGRPVCNFFSGAIYEYKRPKKA